jgi:hypothetical protein
MVARFGLESGRRSPRHMSGAASWSLIRVLHLRCTRAETSRRRSGQEGTERVPTQPAYGPPIEHAAALGADAQPVGALVNVLSVLSWLGFGDRHEVFKAAAWSATNSTRVKPRTLRHRSRPNV